MDARIAAARFPGFAMYGQPYASPNFPGYLPYGHAAAAVAAATDPAALYSPMGPGENPDIWRAGLTHAAAAAYYDPAIAAQYGYGYNPMGLNDGARRKNATRETTSTLKTWLNEHRKNPYPTKGEKIMLAIITKMTLTQVSTWFANARRRLKKENKMTWSPRNRCGEDDEDDDDSFPNGTQDNQHSPCSSPLVLGLPNNNLANHQGDRPRLSDRMSGGESLSDEGANYSDGKSDARRLVRCNSESKDKSENNLSPNSVSKPCVSEDSWLRSSSAHLTRHHPYATPRSSPAFVGFRNNLSSPVPSSIARPGLPFSTSLSHIPQPPILHPGVSGQFNPATAASIFAASRGHPFPPHVMAAFSDQAQMHQYQQVLQNLPIHLFMPPADSKTLTSGPAPSLSPPVSSSSPSTAITSEVSPTTAPQPSKQKIWSLADVATNNDTSKAATKPVEPTLAPINLKGDFHPPSDESGPKDIGNNMPAWMMNPILQHKFATSTSAQNSFPSIMLPQQYQQFASDLTSASHGALLPPNSLQAVQTYPGLAGFMAAQAKAQAAFQENANEECKSGQETHDVTSENISSDRRDSILNTNNRNAVSSPTGSYRGDSAESKD